MLQTCSEHASDVGVSLVEAFVHDGVDERRAVEQHALILLSLVLLCHLLPPVCVTLPQALVADLLDLNQTTA